MPLRKSPSPGLSSQDTQAPPSGRVALLACRTSRGVPSVPSTRCRDMSVMATGARRPPPVSERLSCHESPASIVCAQSRPRSRADALRGRGPPQRACTEPSLGCTCSSRRVLGSLRLCSVNADGQAALWVASQLTSTPADADCCQVTKGSPCPVWARWPWGGSPLPPSVPFSVSLSLSLPVSVSHSLPPFIFKGSSHTFVNTAPRLHKLPSCSPSTCS